MSVYYVLTSDSSQFFASCGKDSLSKFSNALSSKTEANAVNSFELQASLEVKSITARRYPIIVGANVLFFT